jgi:transposase
MPKGKLTTEARLRQQLTRLKNLVKKYKLKIIELQSRVKTQSQEIKTLKEKLVDKETQRKELAGYLYKENRQAKDTKKLGKKSGSKGYQRPKPKPEDITQKETHTLTECPMCSSKVGKAVDTVIKYEEDIEIRPRKIVKEYTITRHWCGKCETFVKSNCAPHPSKIGPNVLGYILYTRYRLRLPFNKIKEGLADLHDFKISEGEISNKLTEAKELFGKEYEKIKEHIKNAKVVYADETGWRMDGQNWWLWVFVDDQGDTQYLIEPSRGYGIPEETLGDKQNRVIVSDGYAVYNKLPGDKQQCWVHLLRVSKVCPGLYQDLAELYETLGRELTKPLGKRDYAWFQKQLQTIQTTNYKDPPAQKVQNRIKRHQDQLLTCLKYNYVLPENNTAERAIRPQVVMRKIFGGNRSANGVSSHEVNSSVIATLLKQNPDKSFFEVVAPLLSPRGGE